MIKSLVPGSYPASYDYATNTSIELTAIPATGYQFAKWSGSVDSSDEMVSLTMDCTKNVTALFTPVGETLTTTSIPDSGGDIRVEPSPDMEQGYAAGTPVTLSAVAEEGYRFSHWSGGIASEDNPVTLVMNSAQEVKAHFVPTSSFSWWWIVPGVGVVAIALPLYFLVTRKHSSSRK